MLPDQQAIMNALVRQESGGNPNALSSKGAAGKFQIMPDTARDPGYGVQPLQGWDGRDPRTAPLAEQERFARDYLAAMAKQNGGDTSLALASYNAGPGAVQKYGGIPPYAETQGYVKNIMSNTGVQMAENTATDWRSRAQPIMSDARPAVQMPAQQAQPTVQAVPNAAPAQSDWKTRAQPVQGDWRNRSEVAQAEGPGFVERVKTDIQKRGDQSRKAQGLYDEGKQTLAETRFQQFAKAGAGTIADVLMEGGKSAYNYVAPDAVKRGVKQAGEYVSDSAVGDVVRQYAGDYSQWAERNPRAAGNVESVVDVANIVPMVKGATAAAQVAGKGVKGTVNVAERLASKYPEVVKGELGYRPKTPKQAPGAAAAEMKTAAGESFKLADELGATFEPNQIANPLKAEVQALKPKPIGNGVLTSDEQKLISHLNEYDGIEGSKLSLNDIKRLDEGLTQKINNNFIDARTGQPDSNGRTLMILQTKLRNLVDDIPDNAANDALKNGRAYWKSQIMLNELDTIAERASMTQNEALSLKTGYRNLYMDKDRIRGWPQEAKDLLKQAAESNWADDTLQLLGSRLPAIIAGGTGNVAGATTAHLAGMAARGGRTKIVAGRGAKVQEAIIKDTKSKIKEIKPSDNSNVPELLLREKAVEDAKAAAQLGVKPGPNRAPVPKSNKDVGTMLTGGKKVTKEAQAVEDAKAAAQLGVSKKKTSKKKSEK